MVTLNAAGTYYPRQLFRALDMSQEINVAVSADYYDLPYQAYNARKLGREYRQGFAGEVIAQILESSPGQPGWVHRAEALHLVSVPLLNEVEPRDLVDLLSPAVGRIIDQRKEYPELHRYAGLLLRTISLAASKLDRYTVAFHFMNRAHFQLATARRTRSAIYIAEAWQQIYLQECGQLSRNVEAALLEQDRERTRLNLFGRLPNQELDRMEELRPLRIVARAAAEAGRLALAQINFVKSNEGLPAATDPEQRRLSVSSWYVTCAIMYMRSLLLAGLVELCAHADPSRYLLPVPDLWASVIETHPTPLGHAEPKLEPAHCMDLTRNALLWAFLHSGDHPYLGTRRVQIRAGVPDYLCTPDGFKLDTIRCANEIARRKHNAGILDNLAHIDTYRLFTDRGGSGPRGYESWLDHRHGRLTTIVDVNDAAPAEIRTVGSPTLKYLRASARMLVRSRRYDSVLRDL